jgi:poly-gamma-glutamate synthesis protein (capsule biosynthesis protein)
MRRVLWTSALLLLAIGAFVFWHQRHRARPPASPQHQLHRPALATITFVGDILLASAVGKIAAAHGTEALFTGVSRVLLHDDLTIGNLECAVATRGTAARKKYTFRAAPALLRGLRAGGIDALSLANNHSLDYGRAALVETLSHLRSAQLPAAGAGVDLQAATQPIFLRAGEQQVALLAASRVLPTTAWCAGVGRPGIAQAYDHSRLLAGIRAARARAEVVIVYLHWGKERALRPQRSQRVLARTCIDAGAHLVVGAHPHVLQGFEYYHGRLIAYSLGNFVFNNRTRTTAMVQTTFRDGALARATVIPCHIVRCRPQVITDSRARRQVLQDLEARSFGVRIRDDGAIEPLPAKGPRAAIPGAATPRGLPPDSPRSRCESHRGYATAPGHQRA